MAENNKKPKFEITTFKNGKPQTLVGGDDIELPEGITNIEDIVNFTKGVLDKKDNESNGHTINVNVDLGDDTDPFEELYLILEEAKKLAEHSYSSNNLIDTGLLVCALIKTQSTTLSKAFATQNKNILDLISYVTKFSFFGEKMPSKAFTYDVSNELRDIIYSANIYHQIDPNANIVDVVSKLALTGERNNAKLALTALLGPNSITFLEDALTASIFSNKSTKNSVLVPSDITSHPIYKALTKDNPENLPNELINLSKRMEGKHPVLAKRDGVLRKLQNSLCTMEKPNALLVGPAGTGKSAIVEYLAYLLAIGKSSPLLKGKSIYQLDLASFVSGTKYVGELEAKFIRLMKTITSMDNAIIFLDEAHTIMGAGRGENTNRDVAQLLKPYLARGEMRMIGATTEKEYEAFIKRDAAFDRRFHIIQVLEPTIEDTIDMVSIQRAKRESFYNVIIPEELVPFIVEVAEKEIKDVAFPDKAVSLMDMACVIAVEKRDDKNQTIELTKNNIEDALEK